MNVPAGELGSLDINPKLQRWARANAVALVISFFVPWTALPETPMSGVAFLLLSAWTVTWWGSLVTPSELLVSAAVLAGSIGAIGYVLFGPACGATSLRSTWMLVVTVMGLLGLAVYLWREGSPLSWGFLLLWASLVSSILFQVRMHIEQRRRSGDSRTRDEFSV